MAKTEYLGKFLDYDLENNILSIKIEFITPEEQAKLEKGVLEKQNHKFKHSISNSSSVSYNQLKCWHGSIRTILVESELLPTAERLHKFDIEMRKRFFPAIEVEFGDFDKDNEWGLPEPKGMREMTHEEMGTAIGGLHELYDYIDWSKYIDKV